MHYIDQKYVDYNKNNNYNNIVKAKYKFYISIKTINVTTTMLLMLHILIRIAYTLYMYNNNTIELPNKIWDVDFVNYNNNTSQQQYSIYNMIIYHKLLYTNYIARYESYICGCYLACLHYYRYYQYNNNITHILFKYTTTKFVLCIMIIISIMYISDTTYQTNTHYITTIYSILYYIFLRIIFILTATVILHWLLTVDNIQSNVLQYMNSILSLNICHRLSQYTYSIYIYTVLVAGACMNYDNNDKLNNVSDMFILYKIIQILCITMLLSYILHNYIEKRIISYLSIKQR